MSAIEALVARARAAVEAAPAEGPAATERERLARLASEFESMLLNQVLSEMRSAGRWDDDEAEDGFGAQAFFETLDAELTKQLSRAQGFGLSRQLLDAFDRMAPHAPAGSPGATGAAIASVSPPGAGRGMVMGDPIPDAKVTATFGWRQHPISGAPAFHKGIDLRAAYGQDVAAAAAGRVVVSRVENGYGTTVVLEHPDGMRSRYAHLSTTLVAEGDEVREGQPIGRAGNSGRSTGPHLHFEVTDREGRPLDPQRHLGRAR